jgi:hypothetical protein
MPKREKLALAILCFGLVLVALVYMAGAGTVLVLLV